MASAADRIKEIEEEIKRTQVNKATEHHLGELKAKMAKFRREMMKPKATAGGGGGFDIKKSGNSTVVFIGFPSVGKSTLLNQLTNAKSEVAQYEFTTLTVIPGVLEYKGARIQMLDVPGIIQGAASGRGRGREVLSVARNADLLLLMLDVFQARTQLDVILRELEAMGIRPNEKPPNVVVKQIDKGGITLNTTVKLTKITEATVESVLNVYGIFSADVVIRQDITQDQFIDVVVGNRRYLPALVLLNKCDLVERKFTEDVKKNLGMPSLEISADNGAGLDALRDKIYGSLRLIRIYTKPRFEDADLSAPLILREGATVGDMCDRVHRGLRAGFRHSFVWGKSAKFPGQKVGIDHVLIDGDVVNIVSR